MQTMKINKKGFTMIEVMIVIAIIGIIAAIAIPKFVKHKAIQEGCPCQEVQSISNITKVDIDQEKKSAVIHTAEATYVYTPVDFSKGSEKINYSHTKVYHCKSTTYCLESYYFKGGD
jgi:type IV pilus assembly protein PilA